MALLFFAASRPASAAFEPGRLLLAENGTICFIVGCSGISRSLASAPAGLISLRDGFGQRRFENRLQRSTYNDPPGSASTP
jgi:hypothetical protein